VTLLSRIQWFSSATSATWLATWTGLLFELHWVLSHSKLGGWPGVAVTIPGTTLCSAMVTSCVLVCSCTSCGQTLLLLHRTQSLAYVLGLALGTLLGVFGFGVVGVLPYSVGCYRHTQLPPLFFGCLLWRVLLSVWLVSLRACWSRLVGLVRCLGSVCWSRLFGLLR
jgi:hypothetical protein